MSGVPRTSESDDPPGRAVTGPRTRRVPDARRPDRPRPSSASRPAVRTRVLGETAGGGPSPAGGADRPAVGAARTGGLGDGGTGAGCLARVGHWRRSRLSGRGGIAPAGPSSFRETRSPVGGTAPVGQLVSGFRGCRAALCGRGRRLRRAARGRSAAGSGAGAGPPVRPCDGRVGGHLRSATHPAPRPGRPRPADRRTARRRCPTRRGDGREQGGHADTCARDRRHGREAEEDATVRPGAGEGGGRAGAFALAGAAAVHTTAGDRTARARVDGR